MTKIIYSSLFWCLSALAVEPWLSHTPQIENGWQFKLGMQSFQEVELQEMDSFDGWTVDAEAVWSFQDRFRLRLNYPLRTEGEANYQGQNIDIRGNAGVYDYLSLRFEHQMAPHWAYYIGAGTVPAPLDTDKPNDQGGQDKLSHAGNQFEAGLLWQWREQQLLNLGLRYYQGSDDIYPGDSDDFWALDLRYAYLFQPWNQLYPAIELHYFGDFSDLNQSSLIPQLIWSINDHLAIKGGATLGLGGTGNQLGGQLQFILNF